MENLEAVKAEAGGILIYSESLEKQSMELAINSPEDLKQAANFKAQCKSEIARIEESINPRIKSAHQLHKDLLRDKGEGVEPFQKILDIINPKILKFQDAEEEREQREREAKVAAQRIEEANAKAEAEKAKEAQVDALMDAGDFDKAEAVMEAPTPEPMAAYVPEAPKVKIAGAGTRKVWKGRELDFSKIPDKFKMLDQKEVNKYASEKAEVPGIEFYQVRQVTGK